MDPLTQGVLGAVLSQSAAKKKQVAAASLFGWLGGMAADLDVLIRSDKDPLLFLEYHRQFSHALIFIPFGGLLCGLLLYFVIGRRWSLSFRQSWLFCTLGYATHGLLDACTSYGTQLLWPFSNARVDWSVLPIIDPVYTLPLLALVIYTVIKKNPKFARIAMIWVLAYPLIGMLQRDRAEAAGWELAAQRGHQPVRLEAKPSLGNLWLWKVIYEADNRYWVDAVRVAGKSLVYPGESVPKLNMARDFHWVLPDSQQAKDIDRFSWFSQGFVAQDLNNPRYLIDVRYSAVPNQIAPLWGILLSPTAKPGEHVRYQASREISAGQTSSFINMLVGKTASH